MRRFLVSAAHKSSGKTTVSVGLAAALAARGLAVQTFKKGPDYIDPMWLTLASGRRCRNLDPYLCSEAEIRAAFARHGAGADVALVEGNKGLYDGLALDGSNSNAASRRLLDLPVVLVIDARGMTRGIAPLILGYQAFDRDIRIAGVILNQLGGSRHEAKLRAVIEHYTDVPGAGRRPARSAPRDRRAAPRPHALQRSRRRRGADRRDRRRDRRARSTSTGCSRWPRTASPPRARGDCARRSRRRRHARRPDRHRAGPRLRLLLRRRPRRARRAPVRRSCASTRSPTPACRTSTR